MSFFFSLASCVIGKLMATVSKKNKKQTLSGSILMETMCRRRRRGQKNKMEQQQIERLS